ncbi:MED24-like protein [Mya arenaria]|uniref:Mediator of RNA polymerase II transcription subunit 24 n=1 Tax=Mya arenaria TaxID=6604 RepID=A0ABY7DFD7_MYAAR|nr:MED24-like protein [Mya arenaria]
MASQTAGTSQQMAGKSDSQGLISRVKSLLVRAWRERWPDIQWGIHFKRLVHTSNSEAGARECAEILLQEALVGTHPNSLILSYLKHATFSKLLPVSATFQYITNYDDFSKPHCLLALVDLAQHLSTYMGFSYGSEGGLALCHTLQSLVYWLLKVMLRSAQQFLESEQTEHQNLLHSGALALQAMAQSQTIASLLVKQMAVTPDAVLDVSSMPICSTIVTMVMQEAILNPTSDIQPFVDQLFIIEKLVKCKRSYLFCEVLRGCFIGLVDLKPGESQEQFRMCAFTYLKVPQILQKIQQQSPSRDFVSDLEAGFERLLHSTSMLDLADSRHNCDLLGFLLGECTKLNLLSAAQQKSITAKSKNQEAQLGVLQHMLKSFELIMAAAAATGKLQTFCFKLINCMELITSNMECINTFFVQWVLRCLPEDGKYKSVDISMSSDSSKVDFLLNALTSGSDYTQGSPKWHEICNNMPYAIQEMILNYVKNRMLSLPVCVVAWMCSYINMLSDDARTKPLSMLQQLIQPLSGDNLPSYYAERSQLMQSVVHKMIQDILPPAQRRPNPQYVPANSLPADVMATTLKAVFTQGWLDMDNLHCLEALLNLCGSDWFADRQVQHMLESHRVEEMHVNLGLAAAITHMDLEHIALSVLLHTLPNLLLSADSHAMLTDPRGSVQKESRRGRKRSRNEFDLDDFDDFDSRHLQTKRAKMEPQITLDSEGFNFDFLNVKEDTDAAPVIDTKDPLNKALINLFRLMNAIVHDGEISPKTSFVIGFIDEAVKCGPHARYILQFMPSNMLSRQDTINMRAELSLPASDSMIR